MDLPVALLDSVKNYTNSSGISIRDFTVRALLNQLEKDADDYELREVLSEAGWQV